MIKEAKYNHKASVTTLIIKIEGEEAKVDAYYIPRTDAEFNKFMQAISDFMDQLIEEYERGGIVDD